MWWHHHHSFWPGIHIEQTCLLWISTQALWYFTLVQDKECYNNDLLFAPVPMSYLMYAKMWGNPLALITHVWTLWARIMTMLPSWSIPLYGIFWWPLKNSINYDHVSQWEENLVYIFYHSKLYWWLNLMINWIFTIKGSSHRLWYKVPQPMVE